LSTHRNGPIGSVGRCRRRVSICSHPTRPSRPRGACRPCRSAPDRAARCSRSVSANDSTSSTRNPARHRITISARIRCRWIPEPAVRVTAMIPPPAGIGGIPPPPIARAAPAPVPRYGRRRPPPTRRVKQLDRRTSLQEPRCRTTRPAASGAVSGQQRDCWNDRNAEGPVPPEPLRAQTFPRKRVHAFAVDRGSSRSGAKP